MFKLDATLKTKKQKNSIQILSQSLVNYEGTLESEIVNIDVCLLSQSECALWLPGLRCDEVIDLEAASLCHQVLYLWRWPPDTQHCSWNSEDGRQSNETSDNKPLVYKWMVRCPKIMSDPDNCSSLVNLFYFISTRIKVSPTTCTL